MAATSDQDTLQKLSRSKLVWERFYPLACLSTQAHINISEEEWKAQGRSLGQAFVAAYTQEDVTTYLHIFVYHYGYFLATYDGIEKFANFDLEGKHSVIKRILAHSTSGFSYGPSETARQELSALLRAEVHALTAALPPTSTKTSWAEEILPQHPSIQQYVVSSKWTS